MAHGPEGKQRASPARGDSRSVGLREDLARGHSGKNFLTDGMDFWGWLAALAPGMWLQDLSLVWGLNLRWKPEVRELGASKGSEGS